MKVTKFGHCCLLVQEEGLRILTDPGNLTTAQNNLSEVDVVLITHDHQDHLHLASLQEILKNNPNIKIITTTAVGELLKSKSINDFQVVEEKQEINIDSVKFKGFGTQHAVVHSDLGDMANTGYLIANKLFYPGDAFTQPDVPVDILALPVAGPWMKISEAIEYAMQVKPRKAFPVHDGILVTPGAAHNIPNKILPAQGIEWKILEAGLEYEF